MSPTCIRPLFQTYPLTLSRSTRFAKRTILTSLSLYGFGNYLRLSHVVNARKTFDFKRFLPRRFELLPTLTLILDVVATPDVRTIWSSFLRYVTMGMKGPFRKVKQSDTLDNLVEIACKLFPYGLPDNTWTPVHAHMIEYEKFFTALYRKTPPTPIATRWYSVEAASYYYFSMAIFEVLPLFVDGAKISHFPGDDYVAADEMHNYSKR